MPETTEHIQRELDLQILLGAAWTQMRGWAAPEVGFDTADLQEAKALLEGLG